MKTIKIFGLFAILFVGTANSCDPDSDGTWDGRLTIVNNSSDTIISFLQYNYPDTTLLSEDAPELDNILMPPNTKGKHYSSIKWEERISKLNKQNTVMVFINSYDTIRKYSWDKIQLSYNILRRYDLTIDTLRTMNWTITYP